MRITEFTKIPYRTVRKDLTTTIHLYMAAQNEALALLEWLKKFGLALLKKSDN